MSVQWKPIPEQFRVEYRDDDGKWFTVAICTGHKIAGWIKEVLLWVVVPPEIRVCRDETDEVIISVQIPDKNWG